MVTAVVLAGCGGEGGVATYEQKGGSMEPALENGAKVNVDRAAYTDADPKAGDIVVFHPASGIDRPSGGCGAAGEGNSASGHLYERACAVPKRSESSKELIKRIVALPGDRIAIVGGRVIRNGVRQREPYVEGCRVGCTFPKPIVIHGYYVMSDKRDAADDSRFWGPVPKEYIVGKVTGKAESGSE